MRDLIERLKHTFSIPVSEESEAWVLLVAKPEGLSFELVVPHDVLEWFVTARVAHSAVWSDWADYYPVAGETAAQLKQDMAADMEWFVTTLLASPLRLPAPATLEWQRDGHWQKISMCVI